LLAVNGFAGLAAITSEPGSPRIDLSSPVAGALSVLVFVWPDRVQLTAQVRGARVGRRSWWLIPATLAGLALFMEIYVRALGALGAETLRVSDGYARHGWPAWSAFALLALAPALVEEVAFRGFLYGRLAEVMGPREALVVQAAMFSVLHMLPLMFVSHFVMGLVFGLLRTRTGSLVPSMIVHLAWNALVVARELAGG